MVTPLSEVKLAIKERSRYTPVSREKAHRGSVPNWTGTCQPTVKKPGDYVITDQSTFIIGEAKDEQPSRASSAQER